MSRDALAAHSQNPVPPVEGVKTTGDLNGISKDVGLASVILVAVHQAMAIPGLATVAAKTFVTNALLMWC